MERGDTVTGSTATKTEAAPLFRRQSATGAEQDRRKAWGTEMSARVRAAVKQAIEGN